MDDITAVYDCSQCGRAARAIPACSERASGRCAFVVQWESRKLEGILAGLASGLAAVTLFVAILGREYPLFGLIAVPMTMALALRGLLREIQLYGARQGIRLQRMTLAGIGLSYRWISNKGLLPIRLDLGQPLPHPLSIASLAALPSALSRVSMPQAAAILRAALIDLLARDYIGVYLIQNDWLPRWRRSPSRATYYAVSAKCKPYQAGDAGALEKEILWALTSWPANWLATSPIRIAGIDDPSLYDLVRAIDSQNGSGYSDWLVGRVARAAAARSLTQLKTHLLGGKTIVWDATQATQLCQEQQILQVLSERLARLYPTFSSELDRQILKAIRVREPSDD